jgi:hypothetical protein
MEKATSSSDEEGPEIPQLYEEKAASLSDEENPQVPQLDKENYLVEWDENDKLNPRNLPMARKWLIVLIVSIGSLLV